MHLNEVNIRSMPLPNLLPVLTLPEQHVSSFTQHQHADLQINSHALEEL